MYNIIWKSNLVGTAEVFDEGLYYRFSCKCTIRYEGIYRIIVINGMNMIDLGICVPEKNNFVLYKRIPKKLFKEKTFSFKLIPSNNNCLVNICSGMACDWLDKINTARLVIVNGLQKIVIDIVQAQ